MYRMVTIFLLAKELVQADLLDTLNMVVKSIEKFLETVEKRLYFHKNHHPSQKEPDLARSDLACPLDRPDFGTGQIFLG